MGRPLKRRSGPPSPPRPRLLVAPEELGLAAGDLEDVEPPADAGAVLAELQRTHAGVGDVDPAQELGQVGSAGGPGGEGGRDRPDTLVGEHGRVGHHRLAGGGRVPVAQRRGGGRVPAGEGGGVADDALGQGAGRLEEGVVVGDAAGIEDGDIKAQLVGLGEDQGVDGGQPHHHQRVGIGILDLRQLGAEIGVGEGERLLGHRRDVLLLQPLDDQVGDAVTVGAGAVDDRGTGVARPQQLVGDREGVGGEGRGHDEDRLRVLGRLQDLGRGGVGRQEGEVLPAGGGGHGHRHVGDARAHERHHVAVVDDRAHVAGPVGGHAGVVELLERDAGALQGPAGDPAGVVDLAGGEGGAVADVVAGGLGRARERSSQGDGEGLALAACGRRRVGRVTRRVGVVAARPRHQAQCQRQCRRGQPPPLHALHLFMVCPFGSGSVQVRFDRVGSTGRSDGAEATLAQHPTGGEQEDADEQGEGGHVAEAGGEVPRHEALDGAQGQSAEKGSPHPAQPAQDGGDEALQRGLPAEGDEDLAEEGGEQGAGQAPDDAGQGVAGGQGAGDGQARQPGQDGLVGHRPDAPAGHGAPQQQGQHQGDEDPRRQHPPAGGGQAVVGEQVDPVAGEEAGGGTAALGIDLHRDVAHDQGHSEGGEETEPGQARPTAGGDGGVDGQVDHHPDGRRRRGRRHHAEGAGPRHRSRSEADVGRQHERIAVGQVQLTRRAQDQAQAGREQRVEQAEGDAGHADGEKQFHVRGGPYQRPLICFRPVLTSHVLQ